MQAKDLIVLGSSRLLGKIYCGDIEIGGTANFSGKITTNQLVVSSSTDISGTSTPGTAPFVVGNISGAHIEIDPDEIIAKNNAATSNLYLNYNGGNVYLSGNTVYASGSTMYGTTFSGTTGNITNITSNTITNQTSITNKGNIYNINGRIETDQIKSNIWDIVSTQNLGGDFFVAPTIMVTNNSTVTITSVSGNTLIGTIKDTTNITSNSFGGHTWSSGSKIKITGKLTKDSNNYILGVCDGTLTANMNTTANTINFNVTCNATTKPPTGTYTITEGTVMMYNVGGSNRVGIYMTCYGTDKYTYIDIYNGSNGNKPVARLGKLDNLGTTHEVTINGENPTGYGLFTNNGYFEGKIVANGGKIGGYTIGTANLTKGTTQNASGSFWLTPEGISTNMSTLNNGALTWAMTVGQTFGVTTAGALYSTSGKIGPWNLSTTYFRNGNIANATNTSVSGVYLGTDGLNISNGTAATTSYITKSAVNIGNKLTWNGSVLKVDGEITASKLTISSGATIGGDGASQILNSEIEVGGRNLFLNSMTERVSPASTSASAYVSPVVTLTSYGDSIVNNTTDIFTYSFDYEVTNNTATDAFVYAQIRGSSIQNSLVISANNNNTSNKQNHYVNDNPIGKYICTFTINSTQASATSTTCNVRLRNATDGAILKIWNVKLEKGNKATDWTPAPEDTQDSMFVQGTGTTAGLWEGTLNKSSLTNGMQITYWTNIAGSSSIQPNNSTISSNIQGGVPATVTSGFGGTWLNLTLSDGTETGWYPCFYGGSTRLNTQYGVNNAVRLIFKTGITMSINSTSYTVSGWWSDANYNSNTIGIYGGQVTAGTNGIRPYGLIMKTAENQWSSLTTSASTGTGTTKTKYSGGFILGKVLYNANNSTYNSGGSAGTCYDAYAIDLRYSTNCGSTLVKGKDVYLVGTLTNGLFYLNNTWWTQTQPSSEDGYLYIYLGTAYSTYQMYLSADNPTFKYVNGKFQNIDATTATNCITEISNVGIWVTPSGKKPNSNGEPIVNSTTGTLINADGVGIYKTGKCVAQYGDIVIIGQETDGSLRTKIDNDTFWITNGTKDIAFIGNENRTVTDTFISDGSTLTYDLSTTWSSGGTFSPSSVTGSKVSGENKININSGTLPPMGSSFTYTYTPLSSVVYYTMGIRDSESAIGEYSFVEGKNNTASGFSSHAEGYDTTASGYHSHTEGYHTTASGSDSHTEGSNTTASGSNSHSEGTLTTASGYSCHAEGYKTTASGYGSHTEGYETTASEFTSHAEGYKTTASGSHSHTEGHETTASGYASHTEGYKTIASGLEAHAEGNETIASGMYSHAEGFRYPMQNIPIVISGAANTKTYTSTIDTSSNFPLQLLIGLTLTIDNINIGKIISYTSDGNTLSTITLDKTINPNNAISNEEIYPSNRTVAAYGNFSHAEGCGTISNGDASHSEGMLTAASGHESHAEGYKTTASDIASHAEGYNTTASETSSHAEGYGTTASGQYSHAQNYSTIAQGKYQTVIGKYNTPQGSSSSFNNTDYAFIIGNGTGTSDTDRSNALTVDWNGGLTTSASIWAKRTSSEVQVGVDGAGGRIYMYSTPTNNRLGIYAYNAQNEAVDVLTVDNDQHIYIGAGTVPLQLYNGTGTNKIFMATLDNNVHLGATSYRWKAVYAVNGTIQTSDLKYKSIINNFDWKIDDFIKGLKPIAYKWIDEEDGSLSKRIRFGFGAQDIAKLSKKLNIGDLSLYEASIIEEDKNGMKIPKPYHGEDIDDNKLKWSLKYSEFIAPMVLEIQRLMDRVDKLELEIKELKNNK